MKVYISGFFSFLFLPIKVICRILENSQQYVESVSCVKITVCCRLKRLEERKLCLSLLICGQAHLYGR